MASSRNGTVAAVAAIAFGVACGTSPVPAEFQEPGVQETEYRIAPADVLEIRVWKNPELSVQAPVLPDGTISAPLAGSIAARDLTTAELEDALAERLSEYITAPEVSVVVKEVNSKRISVLGEVARSGQQNLSVDSRVMDALSQAGGFTAFANRKKVKVIRQTPERELEFIFNYDAYRAGHAPGSNVRLLPGDIVVVPD